MRSVRVQTTLRGYTGWVLDQLVAIKGEPQADVAKYLLDRWVDANQQFLRDEFGLTREAFQTASLNAEAEAKGAVVPIDRTDTG